MTEQIRERITFNDLCQREPRLANLHKRIKAVDPGRPGYDPLTVWYGPGGFKSYVVGLVGWYANKPDPILTSPEAYDVAYRALFDALPNCSHSQKRGK